MELQTGIHLDVDGAVEELACLRGRLKDELAAMGLAAAVAGTHPMTSREETIVSGATRTAPSMTQCGSWPGASRRWHFTSTWASPRRGRHPRPERAAPPDPDSARSIGQFPLWQGRDSGFASARTVIFQAFPRTGAPRPFQDYSAYVEAIDGLIASGAVPDVSFLWWDVRLQPALGTVEVRVMDAQSTVGEIAPIVALIQSLARLALEGDPSPIVPGAEVLAENRFLASRDGMNAQLIDATARSAGPGTGECSKRPLAECHPHAAWLGCAAAPWITARGGDRDRRRPPAQIRRAQPAPR